MRKLRLGISTCLLGEPVRYDGGHKLDRFLRDTLGQFVDYVPVCPEVECGLPVPRESMHLEGDPDAPRLVTSRSHRDLTDQMLSWAKRRVRELDTEELSGFIFKSNSPSSGMERIRVYDGRGMSRKVGTGLFARTFMNHFPHVPVVDEGQLHDPAIRENFIERIFVQQRWREAIAEKSTASLVRFHTCHKLLLMAHSPKHCSSMGKLVAESKQVPVLDLFKQYQTMLTSALKLKATTRKHTNVLQHMAGYFKKELTRDERSELHELIGQYHSGYLPLIVPLTIISHYARKFDHSYLKSQYYLNPHPIELQLRNHA